MRFGRKKNYRVLLKRIDVPRVSKQSEYLKDFCIIKETNLTLSPMRISLSLRITILDEL